MDAATLQQMASRIPGGTFMTEMLRNLALMVRDGTAYQRATKQDVTGTLDASPLVAMKSFGGALDSLVGTLGGEPFKGTIGALNSLTAGINALNSAAASHPQAAKDAGGLAGDLAMGGGTTLAGILAGNALSKLGADTAGTAIVAASKAAFSRVVLPSWWTRRCQASWMPSSARIGRWHLTASFPPWAGSTNGCTTTRAA